MYGELTEKGLAIALLLSLLLPYPVTQLLAAGVGAADRKKHWRLVWLILLVINLGVNTAVTGFLYSRFSMAANPRDRLIQVLRLECAYQDFWAMAKTSLFGMIFALGLGLGLRVILSGCFLRRIPRKTVGWLTVLCGGWLLVILMGSSMSLQAEHHLRLAEICRQTAAVVSPAGRNEERPPIRQEESTYITLVNDGFFVCRTGELYLSDDEEHLKKYPLSGFVIYPGETWTVTAAYNHMIDYQTTGNTEIYLSDGQGKILDHVAAPVLAVEECYVRGETEADSWRIVSHARPADETFVAPPVFSCQGGFYDQPFELTLSAGDGCGILYTLDGGTPTAASAHYDHPIRVYDRSGEPNRYRSVPNVITDYLNRMDEIVTEPVDKAFVVRAAAVDAEGRTSEVVTQTYFVGLDQYRDQCVVSIAADPEELFGEDGIFVTGRVYDRWYREYRDWAMEHPRGTTNVIWEGEPEPNFEKRGDASEREGHVEIWNSAKLMDQKAGIRIGGSSTRDTVFKRFSIIAREVYTGNRMFERPVFEKKKAHSVALRSGFLNALVPMLVKDRDIAVLQSRPATLFLNGEYWGETFLTEKYHSSFFAETYGVNEKQVQYLKIGRYSRLTEHEKTVYEEELRGYAERHDLADPETYAEFCRRVDVQSYIDFLCTNVYADNEDMCETLNLLLWRMNEAEGKGEKDGRWRWGLYDMDLRWGEYRQAQQDEPDYAVNTFSTPYLHMYADLVPYNTQPIYQALRKNADFCKQFVLTFMDLVNANFRPENVLRQMAEWDMTDEKAAEFFTKRPDYIVPLMAEEFGLKGTLENVTIAVNDPNGGSIRLNTITPDLSQGRWCGQYYTDYSLRLSAEAKDGYRLAGWEVNGTFTSAPETEAEVLPGGTEIRAVFEQQ